MSQYSYTPVATWDPDTSPKKDEVFSYQPQASYSSIYTYNRAYDHEMIEEQTGPPSTFNKLCSLAVSVVIYILVFITLPISAWFTFKRIQEYERLVIFRLGRLLGSKGPGLVIVLPFIDRKKLVDLRTKAFSVPPQKVITSDGAVLEIGAEVYFTVKDAVKSIVKIQDLNHSLRVLCHTAIPNHLSKRKVGEIEGERNTINYDLQGDLSKTTATWGVHVDRVELSHPKVLQRDNPLIQGAPPNPLEVLGQALFPPGSSTPPPSQLQQLAQLAPSLMQSMLPSVSQQQQHQHTPSRLQGTHVPGPSGLSVQSIVTPRDLVAAARRILSESLVMEFGYIYLFQVTGDDAGTFYLDLKHGQGSAGEGPAPSGDQDVTITVNSADLQSMLNGDLKPFNAYMSGLIQVNGDLRAATQLGDLVDKLKTQL